LTLDDSYLPPGHYAAEAVNREQSNHCLIIHQTSW
jgi:hypothetical protein